MKKQNRDEDAQQRKGKTHDAYLQGILISFSLTSSPNATVCRNTYKKKHKQPIHPEPPFRVPPRLSQSYADVTYIHSGLSVPAASNPKTKKKQVKVSRKTKMRP